MSNTPFHTAGPILAAGFANSCRLYPKNSALHISGRDFSYEELLEKTECVFSQLSSRAVPDLVGIYTTESIWSYASLLAVSLSGACYVPLNPKWPEQRLRSVIKECGLSLVLTEQALPFIEAAQQLILDTQHSGRGKTRLLVEQPLAYLLFTSGTTGLPKGVPVTKANAGAFFKHCKKQYGFRETDRFLQPYELSFDVSVFSIFAAWNAGAAVVAVPEAGVKYLSLAATLSTQGITVSSMVPTVLLYLEKYLSELSFPGLRYSFFSGDKLFQHLAAKWQLAAPNAQIHNCYGPTETTIVCTGYHWQAQTSEREAYHNIVPLGKPFENMDYLLLDKEGERAGELCFSGDQVIPSYLNRAHEDSFFQHGGKRYYRTGDLASVNAAGNLVFHGRKDAQVKINGYRVELAEVELAIGKCLDSTVVVQAEEEQGLVSLVAFIETDRIDEAALKKDLLAWLPAYMVPVRYMAVPVFPRSINDKIDSSRLRAKL